MGVMEKLVELLYTAEELADKRCDSYPNCDSCPADNKRIDCMDWLKADCLLSLGVTVQEWIPVADRKPEDDISVPKHKSMNLTFATVLVCGGAKGVMIANRVNVEPTGHPHLDKLATNGWEWSKGNEDVTHWMPLPKPPKEGGTKENENQVI